MKYLRSLAAWWRRAYGNAIWQQRHAVEEDARRLGGKVFWND